MGTHTQLPVGSSVGSSECQVVRVPHTRDPTVVLCDIADSCVREVIDDLGCSHSVEPSSMTICSQRGSVWASTLSRHRPI